jgi:hypothetical protein
MGSQSTWLYGAGHGSAGLATALSKLAAKAQAEMGKTAPQMLRGIVLSVWTALVSASKDLN